MTLDELIDQTCQRLANVPKKHERRLVTADEVKRILQESRVAEILQQQMSIKSPKQLTVRQVIIRGRKHNAAPKERTHFSYKREFSQGFNAWVGSNGSGKSTILKSIIWALSGNAPNIKGDVKPWIEHIAVEIEISGDGIFTIQFAPGESAAKLTGSILRSSADEAIAGEGQVIVSFAGQHAMEKEVSNFIGNRLGFPSLEWLQGQKLSVEITTRSVSWSTYAQALFIGADDFSDYLFPDNSVNGRHHQKTISMYLGLDLVEAISVAQVARDRVSMDFQIERKQLQNNQTQVQTAIKQATESLEQVERRLQLIDSGESVTIDPAYVGQLNQHVADLTRRFTTVASQHQSLATQITQWQSDLASIERESLALKEAAEFRVFINGLTIDRCPRCEQELQTVPMHEEMESHTCSVCHGELRRVPSVETLEILRKDKESEAKKLKDSIRQMKKDIAQVTKERDQLNQQLEQARAEFSDLARQAQAGFTEEMKDLLGKRGYLQGQIEQLKTQTLEGRSDRLQEMEARYLVLKQVVSLLEEIVSNRYKDLLKTLVQETATLGVAFGVPGLTQVMLTEQMELLVKQHAAQFVRYNNLDVSERLKIKIAFFLSLIALRLREGIGRHPAFCIIDAPGSGEIDQASFKAMLAGLKEFGNKHGENFQILIASTRSGLEDVCKPDQIEERRAGEKFF
ncbi:hypothetical protein ANRL4_02812 [Anaerolineae bacterium]|nr:hypothetical protein ANRL4_02812 [Anaerolineae bacterium]